MKGIKYWAVGLNFSYDIVTKEPDCVDWSSIEGPFSSLKAAKDQAIKWIASDREHLSNEAYSIHAKRSRQFKNEESES